MPVNLVMTYRLLLIVVLLHFTNDAIAEKGEDPLLSSSVRQALADNECSASTSISISGPRSYASSHFCEAIKQIETLGSVEITPGANVTFRSSNLVFGNQFRVFSGGRFSVQSLTGVSRYLSGRLFISNEGRYLDLSSGEYVLLAPNDTEHTIHPSSDGKEYIETIENYRRLRNEWWNKDAIFIRTLDTGLVVDRFEIPESLRGAAKLSPDRSLVAAIWRDESSGESFGDERLTIFSRNGEVLSRSSQRRITSFDWLPDGRLVYTVSNTIYLTIQPNSLDSISIKSFTSSQGEPDWIAASPGGERIAFELKTGGSPSPYIRYRNATLWVMDIDGDNLRLLATSNADTPRVNTPAWSPDGNWVTAVEGHVSGVAFVPDPIETGIWWVTPVGGPPGALYAVPADGQAAILPADGTSTAQPIFRAVDAESVTFVGPGISSRMKWIPSAVETNRTMGNLPADDGTLNQGLSSNIYLNGSGDGDSTAAQRINLADGVVKQLFILTDDDLDTVRDLIYVSHDAQLFSHYFDEIGQYALYIYKRDGTALAGLALESDNYKMIPKNPVRFSPRDTNLVLLPYRNLLSGSDNFGNRYVTVINWNSKLFVKHFQDREYVAADWTPAGDIILAGKEGGIYRASATADGFSEPSLLFSFKEAARDLTVSPDGYQLAYHLAGQIWVSNLDGTGLRRLTTPASAFYAMPEWSPDSKHLAFKEIDDDDQSMDLGWLWVVAADAENIRIGHNTQGAIPLMKQSGEQVRIFGSFSWR